MRKNDYHVNAQPCLKKILGVDVMAVYAFSDNTALTLFAETGADLTCFANANRFASWLGLAPNNKISGGKIISSRLPRKKHYIKSALIQAANSLYRSDNAMGNYFRRLKSRLGPKGAKCAVARKMAIIYFNMITRKTEFNITLFEQNQKRFKEKRIQFLERKLAELKIAA